jgi:hypothetical protein
MSRTLTATRLLPTIWKKSTSYLSPSHVTADTQAVGCPCIWLKPRTLEGLRAGSKDRSPPALPCLKLRHLSVTWYHRNSRSSFLSIIMIFPLKKIHDIPSIYIVNCSYWLSLSLINNFCMKVSSKGDNCLQKTKPCLKDYIILFLKQNICT